jgi:hypothetical protein
MTCARERWSDAHRSSSTSLGSPCRSLRCLLLRWSSWFVKVGRREGIECLYRRMHHTHTRTERYIYTNTSINTNRSKKYSAVTCSVLRNEKELHVLAGKSCQSTSDMSAGARSHAGLTTHTCTCMSTCTMGRHLTLPNLEASFHVLSIESDSRCLF